MKGKDTSKQEWSKVDCDLIRKYQLLSVKISSKENYFSNKDRKKIKRKIIALVDKGYTLEIRVHHDSEKSDSINAQISLRKSYVLARYLDSLNVNSDKIIINSFGNSLAKEKCQSIKSNCNKVYNKNSKIDFKVLGLSDDTWYYDSKKKVWCYRSLVN